MDESHKRIILSTFQHIDESLIDIQNLIRKYVQNEKGLFHTDDGHISENKRKVLADEISQLRSLMNDFMKKNGIKKPKPINTLSKINSIIVLLEIAVIELEPRYIGNYGHLGEKNKEDLINISEEIRKRLQAINTLFMK